MRDTSVERVAVGFFDGVHVGHQAILRRATRAFTFRNHPLSVLDPEKAPRLIMSPEAKAAAMRACGVEEVDVVDFTSETAALAPEEFAARHLVRAGRPRPVVVCGENWRFGAGGRGDAALLREMGFDVEVVPYAVHDGAAVSSSRIRRCLEAGEVDAANVMLGRPYSLSGARFRGKGLGSSIGFPTVNIAIPHEPPFLLPRGVYEVSVCGRRAIANAGVAPTLGEGAWGEPVVEVHFPNAGGDAAEAVAESGTLVVAFLRFIRPERKFASLDELKRQIEEDVRRL